MNPKSLVHAGAFIALGLVLPMAFHAVGLGKTFLPMHLPILLAGFLNGPITGAAVGVITPLLSSALTGMPPISPPIALMMAVELPIYGALAGLAYKRWSLGKLYSLLLALLGGRLVYGFAMSLLLPLFGLEGIPPLYPITTGLLTGLPGVIVQVIVIPTTVTALERFRQHSAELRMED